MINVVKVGPVQIKALNGEKILRVESAEKYSGSQTSYLNLTLKNRFYETIAGFTLDIYEYTGSGTFIKKITISKKDALFDSTYHFDDDLIEVDNDCKTIEVKIVEVDFISFYYRENGFVYPELQKQEVPLEIGETMEIKRRRVYPKYAYLFFMLMVLTLLIICILMYSLGGVRYGK